MSIHILPPLPNRSPELEAAYECIDELKSALNGVLGLIVLISGRPDVSPCLREVFNNNHRIAAAHDALADIVS